MNYCTRAQIVMMLVSYFSQNAAHTSCTLSLQGVLLYTAAHCESDTESPFTPVVFAGHQKCGSTLVLQTAILKSMRKKHQAIARHD